MRAEVLLTLSAMRRGVRQTTAAAVTYGGKAGEKPSAGTVENDLVGG